MQPEQKVYNTCSSSLIITTAILTLLLLLSAGSIAGFLELSDHPEYISWVIVIMALDTLCVMPFANSGIPKARKFARNKDPEHTYPMSGS
jgi:hypothetical protein